jgi:hypothetical protein
LARAVFEGRRWSAVTQGNGDDGNGSDSDD